MNNLASVMKREEYSKRSQTEVTCPCGTTYKLCNQKTHKQSHKHKYYLLEHPEQEPQPLLQSLPQKETTQEQVATANLRPPVPQGRNPDTERIIIPGTRTLFVRKLKPQTICKDITHDTANK